MRRDNSPRELSLERRKSNAPQERFLADRREEAAAERHSQQPIGGIDGEQIGATALEMCCVKSGGAIKPSQHTMPILAPAVKTVAPAHMSMCTITNDRSKQAMKAAIMAKDGILQFFAFGRAGHALSRIYGRSIRTR